MKFNSNKYKHKNKTNFQGKQSPKITIRKIFIHVKIFTFLFSYLWFVLRKPQLVGIDPFS